MVLTVISYIFVVLGILLTSVNLPGIWVVLAGILISAIGTQFTHVTWVWLVIFFIAAVIASVVDNVIVLLGAQKFGASKWGIIGALLGIVVGLLVGGIIGMVFGPFIGAVIFELAFAKKESKGAVKAGFGTIIGLLVSVFVKMTIAIFMVIAWQILLR